MMMTLITVGKTDFRWVREAIDLYASRLSHYVKFRMTEIPELKNVSSLSEPQIKEREEALIMPNLRTGDYVILLDERGEQYSSVAFARYLEGKMSRGRQDIVFVIGGAYGFSQGMYDRADAKISLSAMTFSHQMVRAIFVEQLYRAFTIMKGEPYHHE